MDYLLYTTAAATNSSVVDGEQGIARVLRSLRVL
jgi:hypothetical protein